MATTGTTSARTQGRTWQRLAVAAVVAAFLWGMGLVASRVLLPDATTSKVVPTSFTPIQGHDSPASPTYSDGGHHSNPVEVRMTLPRLRPRFG